MRVLSKRASDALHWLRGAFALLVLVTHARQHLLVPYADVIEPGLALQGFYFLTAFGPASVVGFFVLSGFLITTLYYPYIMDGSLSVQGFLLNRGVRLYIVLVPVLFCSGLFDALFGLGHDTSLLSFFSSILFLQSFTGAYFAGNGPLWSLGYEAWCYLIFCGLVAGAGAFGRGEKSKGIVWLLVGLVPLICLPILMAHYFALWTLGGLAALYMRRPANSSSEIVIQRRLWRLSCLLALGGFVAARSGLPFLVRDYAVALPLAASLALFSKSADDPELGGKGVGRAVANFSYSLYLTHFPLVLLAESLFGAGRKPSTTTLFLFLAVVFACLLYSYCFSLLTERHTSSVQNWLSRKLKLALRPTVSVASFSPTREDSR